MSITLTEKKERKTLRKGKISGRNGKMRLKGNKGRRRKLGKGEKKGKGRNKMGEGGREGKKQKSPMGRG